MPNIMSYPIAKGAKHPDASVVKLMIKLYQSKIFDVPICHLNSLYPTITNSISATSTIFGGRPSGPK